MNILYKQRLYGGRAVAQRNGAQVFDGLADHGTVYSVNKGTSYTTTGYYYQVGGVQYLQTTTGLYIYVDYSESNLAWSVQENATRPKTYSTAQAQSVVDTILTNNQIILCNNLLCARFANKLTEKQRNDVRSLQERLQQRNSALQAEGLVRVDSTGVPGGYAEMSPYLERLMSGEAIGFATWVTIIIYATVIAGLGTAAYYGYKALADESERDVKYSKELTKILTSKLTDEEYQQLLNETKGIVTKAKIKSTLGSYWDVVKWAAIGFAGYTAYKFAKQYI